MITKERAEEIAKEMYQDIFNICYSKPEISADEAEEITQDTFLLFYEKLDFLDDNTLNRWLISVAKKKCYEFYRKNKKEQATLSLEESFNSIDDILITRDKYFAVSESDIQKSFDVIIKALKKDEYTLYYKKYVEKKSHEQIAKEMGISITNVNTRSHRLRVKLENLAKIAFTGFGQLIIRTFF